MAPLQASLQAPLCKRAAVPYFKASKTPPRPLRPIASGPTDVAPPTGQQPSSSGRRQVLGAGAAILLPLLATSPTFAAGLNKYIKKKQLDPLETYVPLVLEARQQLQRLPDSLGDPAEARRLLRSGPFSGLRDNIRAIGEYAGSSSKEGTDAASQLVTNFFKSLEGLDLLLFQAVRDKAELDKGEATRRLQAATGALDALLATVPSDAIATAEKVLDRVNAKAASSSSSPSGGEDLTGLLSSS